MSVADIAGTGGVILGLAYAIRDLGNSYYLSTQAWREFPEQVEQLRRKHEIIEGELERYGQTEHPDLKDAMEKAKKRLESEQARLASPRLGVVKRCCGTFGEIVFPAKVGVAIKRAEKAYDTILGNLRLRDEAETLVRSRARNAPVMLPFRIDGDYISRPLTESKILELLKPQPHQDPGKFNVILLHGATGAGKSTLVRHVSLQLQPSRNPSSESPQFSQVVWLECGQEVSVDAKQLELLIALGLSSSDIADITCQPIAQHVRRQDWLQKFLWKRKLLIVLDDVWDLVLLRSLLDLSGENVKFLVTSQQQTLCQNLTSSYTVKSVEMEPLLREHAQRIFALNAGFANREIPPEFQGYAEAILNQAEGIPLAIAILGAQINDGGNEEETTWRDVLNSVKLFEPSANPVANGRPSRHIHGDIYPRSYWGALKHGMNRLLPEQKQLFLLVGMCKEVSVPDAIVRIFFSVVCSNSRFIPYSKCKRHLQGLQFLTVKDDKSVSMHSLIKDFVLGEMMQDHVRSIVGTFANNLQPESISGLQVNRVPDDMSRLVNTLIYLYLDPKSSKLVLCGGCADTFSDLRRTTIEPIVKLFVLKMNDEVGWTDEYHNYSNQVFMTFIYENQLHNDGISKLLSLEVSTVPILKILATIGLLESFWQDTNRTIEGIPDALLSILRNGTHRPDIQVHVAATIALLSATHRTNCSIVMQAPNMLDHVKETLSSCRAQTGGLPHQSTAGNLIALLLIAAQNGPHDVKRKLADPDMLLVMAEFLLEAKDPSLQGLVAMAIAGLTNVGGKEQENFVSATDKEIPILVANCPGLLDKLVESLQSTGDPVVQEMVTASFLGLANVEMEISEKMVNTPGMLDSLSKLLAQAEDENPDGQCQAARTLLLLTMNTEATSVKDKIASSRSVLESLAKSLSKNHNPLLQNLAVYCIVKLCEAQDVSILNKLLDDPGLLKSLVSILTNDQNLTLQQYAALALQTLAKFQGATIKGRLANQSGLLDALAEALRNYDNPPLQDNAAACLVYLANTEDKAVVEKIVERPNLLKNLAESLRDPQIYFLTEQYYPDPDNKPPYPNFLRHLAAWALANLIERGNMELLQDHFVCCPALLDNLAETFLAPKGSVIQEYGTRALVALAPRAEKAIADGGIVDFSKLLEKLVKALADAQNPDLQDQVARVMCGLSSLSIAIKKEIRSFPGLLKTLAEVLLESKSPQFQELVAQFNANLLQCEDSTASSSFANNPGLLENVEEVHKLAETLGSLA